MEVDIVIEVCEYIDQVICWNGFNCFYINLGSSLGREEEKENLWNYDIEGSVGKNNSIQEGQLCFWVLGMIRIMGVNFIYFFCVF